MAIEGSYGQHLAYFLDITSLCVILEVLDIEKLIFIINTTPRNQKGRSAMALAKKDDLLNSNDVAHMLDESPDDIILMARKGTIRGVKKGKRWKFKKRDVISYMNKLKKEEE